MPSLGDVANQVLDVLNQIHGDTSAIHVDTSATAQTAALIRADTSAIKNELSTIENTLQAGFINLAQGLFAVLEQEKETNSLLTAEVQQNKTIICWLTTLADLLCRIMRKTNTEIELQTEMRNALDFLKRVTELSHSRETVEIQRLAAVVAQVEKCCPPEPPRPEECYKPCPDPDIRIHVPQGGDWKPLQPPKPIG